MTNITTGCPPSLGEPGGVCSGRGTCIQMDNVSTTFICLCQGHYANVGDFATAPNIDCGIDFQFSPIQVELYLF
jgi:hypothetical protein